MRHVHAGLPGDAVDARDAAGRRAGRRLLLGDQLPDRHSEEYPAERQPQRAGLPQQLALLLRRDAGAGLPCALEGIHPGHLPGVPAQRRHSMHLRLDPAEDEALAETPRQLINLYVYCMGKTDQPICLLHGQN